MMDKVEIESKHAPPLAECAHCEHMLPPGLGEIICEVCGAGCRVNHEPTVEALSKFFEKKGGDEAVLILERRMALIEHQLESIESNVQRLAETAEFDRKMGAAPQGQAILAPCSDE